MSNREKIAGSADVVAIMTEPGALSFCTRKEWRELPEICLGELARHETVMAFNGASSVFFLLRDMDPCEYLNDTGNAFQLVKIAVDKETGKQILFIMNLSRAEAALLMNNRLTLWE